MIPQNNDIYDFEIKPQPSKTYRLDSNGLCDGLEALSQAIYLILSIERYEYPIYSWNYGIELKDLYGQPKSFVIPELERRIQEALLQDDRIKSVNNFEFKQEKEKIHIFFTVDSIYGDIKAEKAVKI